MMKMEMKEVKTTILGNSDVVVSLKDGEIITTSFMNSNYYDTKISDDNAKLIFTTVK